MCGGGTKEVVKISRLYLTPTAVTSGLTSNGSLTLDCSNATKLTIESIASTYGTRNVTIVGDSITLATYTGATSNLEFDVTEYNTIEIRMSCANTGGAYSGVSIVNLVME